MHPPARLRTSSAIAVAVAVVSAAVAMVVQSTGGSVGDTGLSSRTTIVARPQPPPFPPVSRALVAAALNSAPTIIRSDDDKMSVTGRYLLPTGVLGGKVRGVAWIACEVRTHGPTRYLTATVGDGLFLIQLGELTAGDEIVITAGDDSGHRITGTVRP